VTALRLVLVAALATACTPNLPATRVKYDGAVAEALAELAGRACVPIGDAAKDPIEKASDFRCTSPDVEMVIHLDTARTLRSVHIKLLAPDTDTARGRLDKALKPVLDDHHRTNILGHLDDPVPGGVAPIPQLALEDFLYQIASQPIEDGRNRYIVRIRID
jgi:hypothetical protein